MISNCSMNPLSSTEISEELIFKSSNHKCKYMKHNIYVLLIFYINKYKYIFSLNQRFISKRVEKRYIASLWVQKTFEISDFRSITLFLEWTVILNVIKTNKSSYYQIKKLKLLNLFSYFVITSLSKTLIGSTLTSEFCILMEGTLTL